MKRKMSLFLAIVLIFGLFVNAGAAENQLTAELSYDGLRDALIVRGTVTAQKGNVPLTLEVLGPDGEFLLGEQTKAPANGFETVLSYEFPAVFFGADFKGGVYTLRVSGYGTDQIEELSYTHIGVDQLFEALGAVNRAISAGDGTGLVRVVRENTGVLGVSQVLLNQLKAEGLEAFQAVLLEKPFDLPGDIGSDSNRKKVKETAVSFRAKYLEAVTVGSYNDIADGTELNSWLEAYAAVNGFDQDDAATAVDEAKLYPYVEKMKGEAVLAVRVSGRSRLTSIKKVRDSLYEDALLSIVEKNHYSEAKALVEGFKSLFPVDYARYDRLKASQKGTVFSKAAGKQYASYSKFADAIDREVDALLDQGGGSGGSGGGGGGSGRPQGWGTEGSSNVNITPSTNTPAPEKPQEFTDLNGVNWAREAVLYLKERNIVSGRGEGLFCPNESVTRAEFVKMITEASGMGTSKKDGGFADVVQTDWFYPYVNAAKENGLIAGDENNCFHPNAEITRQDMAVMLYRAYRLEEDPQAQPEFTDSEAISSYALAAVGYLSSTGVISGMGDGRFAPLAPATRAQAAQMLYRVIQGL